MKDCVIFMSAFSVCKYKKTFRPFQPSVSLGSLFEKYKIDFSVFRGNIITPQGTLSLTLDYDYIKQQSTYHFEVNNKKHNIDDYRDSLRNFESYFKLVHANSVLADDYLFKIDQYFSFKSFLVYIEDEVYQIDPFIFTIDDTFIIAYEVINYSSGKPLQRNDVCGKIGNFNLLKMRGYQYFHESYSTLSNSTIPKLIFNIMCRLMEDASKKRYIADDHAYVHNTLVISSNIRYLEQYICKLVSTRELPSPLSNIASTDNYQYYVQDGSSVVTKFNKDNYDTAVYNALILESIKLYIYLFQIINTDIEDDMNKAARNELYLENLFVAPRVPIETSNFLRWIYQSKSFVLRKEASRLKLAYMNAENESKKNRNSVFLNILLYIISLLGTIGTLETLEEKLSVPFNISFYVVISIFAAVGLFWVVNEFKHNKRF